jgi:hypothetical protein
MTTTLERPAAFSSVVLAELDIAVCSRCAADLEHCHDALVFHAIGEVHCTAADCATPHELHHLVIACVEFACDCASAGAAAATGLG